MDDLSNLIVKSLITFALVFILTIVLLFVLLERGTIHTSVYLVIAGNSMLNMVVMIYFMRRFNTLRASRAVHSK